MALPLEVQEKLTALRRAPGEGDGVTIELPLEYKTGAPPPGHPATVILTAPPAIEDNVIAQRCLDEAKGPTPDPTPALLACLPPHLARREFIEALTFNCHARLTDQAIELVWGKRAADYLVEIDAQFNPSQVFAA